MVHAGVVDKYVQTAALSGLAAASASEAMDSESVTSKMSTVIQRSCKCASLAGSRPPASTRRPMDLKSWASVSPMPPLLQPVMRIDLEVIFAYRRAWHVRGDRLVYIEGRRFLTRRFAWPTSFSQEECTDWKTALGNSERLIAPGLSRQVILNSLPRFKVHLERGRPAQR